MILGAGTCAAVLSSLTSKPRAGVSDARVIAARMDRWWPRPDDAEPADAAGLLRIPEPPRNAPDAPALSDALGRRWPPALLPDAFPEELLLACPMV
ncbi:hypothetical protein LO772_05160 [Yinghuangia sp. ASG 101]|uniref:hypothetical protein n=1 Tax=Yinghuangia sp. ASG 101 TaxID=2896848 RepID=UPI001E65C88E|nr:hypothetical protein [Yinghuangia sp. ASG 101]UGQ13014.1 hypothetical protein LO772_05160 [Yinghuangia sp. ASG 101]